MMSYSLSLLLESFEQSVERLRFRVTFFNRTAGRLFFPLPDIIGLRFRNAADGREAQWFTHMLVSKRNDGFTLEPGAFRPFDWRVRPCGILSPTTEKFSEYGRWCVDITPGKYQVSYHFEVGPEYFDPDSHARLADLQQMARDRSASLWQGQAESNSVTVFRDG